MGFSTTQDGNAVRWAFAMWAPVIPLLLLLSCLSLEAFQHGSGLAVALKVLTVLYIGGASSCADLLSCQTVDGAGKVLPDDFHFRKLLPNLRCQDADANHAVDAVAYVTAMCYGVVIPACLVALFAKQQIVTQRARTAFASITYTKGELQLSPQNLMDFSKEAAAKEPNTRHLVASAAACISVLLRGRVRIQMSGGWLELNV